MRGNEIGDGAVIRFLKFGRKETTGDFISVSVIADTLATDAFSGAGLIRAGAGFQVCGNVAIMMLRALQSGRSHHWLMLTTLTYRVLVVT